MRGNIALAGFFWTTDEWEALDAIARAQLLGAAHAVAMRDVADDYESYEVVEDAPAARGAIAA
ncbi:MAG: hypothetical protein K8W52_42815 [Deltaproteobacteria bacterium]|nr:hypothetical protein [Deltaproteobacteria bacterium]